MTTPTCDQYRQWLAEALDARHNLALGRTVTLVRMGEKHVEYAPANREDLDKYIGQLNAAVARCDGKTAPRQALRFIAVDDY